MINFKKDMAFNARAYSVSELAVCGMNATLFNSTRKSVKIRKNGKNV
jgi:hypothetical protein